MLSAERATEGSNPTSYPKTAFGIYGFFNKKSGPKNPERLDAVGFAPTASKVLGCYGGDEGDRTLDLTDANRTLSQLSYAPVCLLVSFKHYITNFPFVKKNIDYIQNL